MYLHFCDPVVASPKVKNQKQQLYLNINGSAIDTQAHSASCVCVCACVRTCVCICWGGNAMCRLVGEDFTASLFFLRVILLFSPSCIYFFAVLLGC